MMEGEGGRTKKKAGWQDSGEGERRIYIRDEGFKEDESGI